MKLNFSVSVEKKESQAPCQCDRMYYPRCRRDQEENRGRRTRSENFRDPNNASAQGEMNLVEETLKEIRSRNGSTSNERDKRRLSCEEIDQLLTHIRSRSQSLSGRPPPPTASPPPLPSDQEIFSTPFGGIGPTPPPRRNARNRQRVSGKGSFSPPHPDGSAVSSSSHWHENPAYDGPKGRFESGSTSPTRSAAFETVQELKDRLASMAEDLEKVWARADRLNGDLKKEMEKSAEETQ